MYDAAHTSNHVSNLAVCYVCLGEHRSVRCCPLGSASKPCISLYTLQPCNSLYTHESRLSQDMGFSLFD